MGTHEFEVSNSRPKSCEIFRNPFRSQLMAERTYQFGPFVLDGQRRACLRHGTQVAIGQRGLTLLETLLAADGRPVHKNDLLVAAWGTEFIEESNLSVQIAALRKKLGRRRDGTEWITTVQRIGYQFAGEIQRPPPVAANIWPEESPAEDANPSIAVRPFSKFSGETEHRISDGIENKLDEQPSQAIVLNGRVFDTAAEVLRDLTGNDIPLRPQSVAVLKYLALNVDRVITKDELMDAVWSDVAVTENSLVQCIHEIRRALGDERQWALKTVARRGYRLVIGDANTPTGTERDETARLDVKSTQGGGWMRPVLFSAVCVIAAAFGIYFWQFRLDQEPATPPSIAVLPFSYDSDDKKQSYLAAGFTEDVITDLTRFRDLEVIAQNSTKIYSDEPHDIKKVGRDLNVRYVLEGSIRRQGKQLRVTAKLVDASSAAHVWAERWDRAVADIFAVQTELSQELAGKIGGFAGTVLAADKAAAMRKRPGNLTAYDLYLRGIEAKNREDETSVKEAIMLLKRSIEIDPHFARAWTMLGSAYAISTQWTNDVEGTHRLYEEAVTRAVELDPLDAEAHAALGFALARHSQPRTRQGRIRGSASTQSKFGRRADPLFLLGCKPWPA